MNQNISNIGKTKKSGLDVWLSASPLEGPEKKGKGRFFTVVLFAFVVFFLLATLLVGTRVYGVVNASREATDESRLGLSLIANSVRMNDTTGSVGVGKGPEGYSLVLSEQLESGTFETRIYAYQGMIVEEYSISTNAYDPGKAREIVRSERFEFEYSSGLLTVHTDHGSVYIALRSIGGAS